jgi:hypothetical protein
MLKCCPPDRMEQLRKTFFSENCWNLSATAESEFLQRVSLQPDHIPSKSKLLLPYTAAAVTSLNPSCKRCRIRPRNFLRHLPADSYLKYSCIKNILFALYWSRGRLLHPQRAGMHLRATNPMIRSASLVLSKTKISLPFANSGRELTWPWIWHCLWPPTFPWFTTVGKFKRSSLRKTSPHSGRTHKHSSHWELQRVTTSSAVVPSAFGQDGNICSTCCGTGEFL